LHKPIHGVLLGLGACAPVFRPNPRVTPFPPSSSLVAALPRCVFL
jgi:hypothetical protein